MKNKATYIIHFHNGTVKCCDKHTNIIRKILNSSGYTCKIIKLKENIDCEQC